jgi:hypothetical protein
MRNRRPEYETGDAAQVEIDVLIRNQPGIRDLTSEVVTLGGKRFVVIDYTRSGRSDPAKFEDEHVRQYSAFASSFVYRLTCSALASQFATYEGTFQSAALSLKVAEELEPAAGR